MSALVDARTDANERFFAAEAERLAELCRAMAERFVAGGRLLATGVTEQDRSDAHHVAVEFVHPVIVGKRALPALAVDASRLEVLARPNDMLLAFGHCPEAVARARARGCLVLAFDELAFPTDDPFVRQELAETAYHVLWELVHVFFEHLGGSAAGAGASAFLYPFLEREARSIDAVVADVRSSVLMKAAEVADLRARTLQGSRDALAAAAVSLRESLDAGGTVLAFGNGGSATDAMDVVADFRAAPQGWAPLRALDLTADSAILTALANDVGPEVLFQRQVIALGAAGDVALAFSTSGGSANILEGLAEARRRGLVTVALVGYDGGRIASEGLADHVVLAPSQHIPRIQEAHASAYHVLRDLVET